MTGLGEKRNTLKNLVGKLKGTCHMGLNEVVLLKISYANRMWGCQLDASGVWKGEVVECCKHSNNIVGSTKCVGFPDYLRRALQYEFCSMELTLMLCTPLCLEFSAWN